MKPVVVLLAIFLFPAGVSSQGLSITAGPVAHSFAERQVTPGLALGYEGGFDLGPWSWAWAMSNTSFPGSHASAVVTLQAGPARLWVEDNAVSTLSLGPSVVLRHRFEEGPSDFYGGVAVLAERRWRLGDSWSWSLGVLSSLHWISISEKGQSTFPLNEFWLEPRIGISWER